jgi:hypothetical protein
MVGSMKGYVSLEKIYRTVPQFSQASPHLSPQVLYTYVFFREGQVIKLAEEDDEEMMMYSTHFYNTPP